MMITHFLTASSCSWLYFGWISWQSAVREPRREDAGEFGAERCSVVSDPSSAVLLLSAVASWFNRSDRQQTKPTQSQDTAVHCLGDVSAVGERRQGAQHRLIIEVVALSRISPRVRVRVSVSIVLGLASGGYSWIWPKWLILTLY